MVTIGQEDNLYHTKSIFSKRPYVHIEIHTHEIVEFDQDKCFKIKP